MRDFYLKYNTEDSWLIKEEGWARSLQGVRESQFSLGNGLWGSRGILEEIPYDCSPGTYIAGIYDKIGAQVTELVNFPNPFNFKITAKGEKIDVVAMDVLKHKRILNIHHGILSRHTIFKDSKGRMYDYQSIRFISMHNKNIGVMQIVLTPLDDKAELTIQTGIDTSVFNAGVLTEGRKRHFRIKELAQFDNEGYLAVDTLGKSYSIIYRSGFHYKIGSKKTFAKDNIFELKLNKNQAVVFTKIFYLDFMPIGDNFEKAKKLSEVRFRKAFNSSFDGLIKKHISAWEDLWSIAGVSIWGVPEVEKNFRFAIYHMIICANDNNGFSSIGARTLSGEGYRGHIFWDTEIFLLPFYIHIFPDVAKSLLLYRHKRLEAARDIAKESGYKGAMFPWESADSGQETTPTWAKNLDGRVIKIYTDKMEHHITADIVFALYHYYVATGDESFMEDFGYEILFETARFWASRVEYNSKKKKYEIKHVIGPDEFHEDVNNNAYTNMMAKWNLNVAYKMFKKIKNEKSKVNSSLITKIGLDKKEVREWKRIAPRICMNVRKDKVIEQFDSFFKKRKVKIREFDENSMPLLPKGIKVKDFHKTQLVKQADVIMLLYLLLDVFSSRTKKVNYQYYIDKTLHKSSLSPSMHALMALDVGDLSRAYQFFNVSLHTDIANIHGNTNEGVHAACFGGTWQIVINGFAGVKIVKEVLTIDPKIPKNWRKILFSLKWRGDILKLEINHSTVNIRVVSGKENNNSSKHRKKRMKLKVRVFGILRELVRNKKYVFDRKVSKSKIQQYY